MPKAAKTKGNTRIEPTGKGLLVVIHNGRRVLISRHKKIEDMELSCRKIFTVPQGRQLLYFTKDLDVCDGHLTEICSDAWADVVGEVSEVILEVVSESVVALPSPPLQEPENPPSTVVVKIQSKGCSLTCRARLTLRWAKLASAFCARAGLDECAIRFSYDCSRISPDQSLHDIFGDDTNPEVYAWPVQVGGKPVIYLYSPETLDAVVKLSLVPQWSLSATYPVVPTKASSEGVEQVQWRVRTRSTGDLTELTTGIDVAYLFWEAHTNAEVPPSPPASPSTEGPVETFDPAHAALADHNSVVLSSATVTPYLDAALKVMGLHTEARTSFITYWLPSILKHKNIALGFVPQRAYEKAAPLDISPVPDVVTRVFMVFEGVEDAELEDGGRAAGVKKAEEDPSFWAGIVGVDVEKSVDETLFRVIEWGGMEVVRPRGHN